MNWVWFCGLSVQWAKGKDQSNFCVVCLTLLLIPSIVEPREHHQQNTSERVLSANYAVQYPYCIDPKR